MARINCPDHDVNYEEAEGCPKCKPAKSAKPAKQENFRICYRPTVPAKKEAAKDPE